MVNKGFGATAVSGDNLHQNYRIFTDAVIKIKFIN